MCFKYIFVSSNHNRKARVFDVWRYSGCYSGGLGNGSVLKEIENKSVFLTQTKRYEQEKLRVEVASLQHRHYHYFERGSKSCFYKPFLE